MEPLDFVVRLLCVEKVLASGRMLRKVDLTRSIRVEQRRVELETGEGSRLGAVKAN